MLQAQQERGKQSDMMQHSLQSLRVDIGQLLQEMIVDDDSQHKKLKEVLHQCACVLCVNGTVNSLQHVFTVWNLSCIPWWPKLRD